MRWRRRSTADFSSEIQAHIAHETDRLVAEGMSPEEAARAARKAFGNIARAHEHHYESGRTMWLDQMRQDVRAAVRNLRRYPVVSVVAILSLGAGIGATAASLTVRDVIFQNPPPLYAQPEQLSKVQVNRQDRPIRPLGSYVPGDLYALWRQAIGHTMAATGTTEGVKDVRTGDRLSPVRVRAVTDNFFSVLGVGPEIGRVFNVAGSNDSPEAVLSYRLWQDWFKGRPDALGQTIWIDNRPHTIVGVMPQRFWFSELNDPIWTRLPSPQTAETSVQVVVRRAAGTSEATLAARLQGVLAEYSTHLPAAQGPLHLRVSAIKGTPIGDQMAAIFPYIIGSAVLLTLIIACANVAILMIAQWTRRETETAVRSALGASRSRLIRALIAESLLLASCAGVIGIGGTYVLRAIMLRGATLAPVVFDLSIHPGVLIKSIAITLGAGILAGIGPALIETRRLQIDPLRGIATSDRVRQRWSHTLVVLEITMTLALLVVTSSMIAGFQRSLSGELGFAPEPLLTALATSPTGVPVALLVEQLEGVPGVEAVAPATSIPLTGLGRRQAVSAESTGTNPIQAEQVSIGQSFFSTLRVPLRGGRAFTNQDTIGTRTAILNETFASRLFGTAPPIGRQVWIGTVAYEVVGVVADYMSNPIESRLMTPKIFLPLSADPTDVTSMRFLIRAHGDPVPLVDPVRRALRDASVGIVVSNTFTLPQMMTLMGKETLAGTAPLFPLIVIGMMLMSSGIYGVLAFAVSRRTRELAVRVAIGADRGNQVRLVMAHSLRLVLLGATFGIALTFGLSRLLRAAGGEGSLYDPPWPAFVVPVLVVLGVGLLATWIPTRRALRINPAVLLRSN